MIRVSQGIEMTYSGDRLERKSYEKAEEIIFSLIERISLGQGIKCRSKDCRFFLAGCTSMCGVKGVYLRGGICKYYRKYGKDGEFRKDIDQKIFKSGDPPAISDVIEEDPLVMLINSLIDHIGHGEGIECETYNCKYWQPDFGDGCGCKRIILRKGICWVYEKGSPKIRKDLELEQMFYPENMPEDELLRRIKETKDKIKKSKDSK